MMGHDPNSHHEAYTYHAWQIKPFLLMTDSTLQRCYLNHTSACIGSNFKTEHSHLVAHKQERRVIEEIMFLKNDGVISLNNDVSSNYLQSICDYRWWWSNDRCVSHLDGTFRSAISGLVLTYSYMTNDLQITGTGCDRCNLRKRE